MLCYAWLEGWCVVYLLSGLLKLTTKHLQLSHEIFHYHVLRQLLIQNWLILDCLRSESIFLEIENGEHMATTTVMLAS